jgi:hypothetical protein
MTFTRSRRRGFSFLELVASLGAATALVIGLASTLGVAIKASNPGTTPASSTLAALNLLAEISSELTYTKAITEKTAVAITATVPDRNDADSNLDTVRYSWSGTPGQSLECRFNGGSSAIAAATVYDFNVSYYPASGPVELLFVRLQLSADARTAVETTIPLLNRP